MHSELQLAQQKQPRQQPVQLPPYLRPLRRSRRVDRLRHKRDLQRLPTLPPRQRIAHCLIHAAGIAAVQWISQKPSYFRRHSSETRQIQHSAQHTAGSQVAAASHAVVKYAVQHGCTASTARWTYFCNAKHSAAASKRLQKPLATAHHCSLASSCRFPQHPCYSPNGLQGHISNALRAGRPHRTLHLLRAGARQNVWWFKTAVKFKTAMRHAAAAGSLQARPWSAQYVCFREALLLLLLLLLLPLPLQPALKHLPNSARSLCTSCKPPPLGTTVTNRCAPTTATDLGVLATLCPQLPLLQVARQALKEEAGGSQARRARGLREACRAGRGQRSSRC